jgi:hypothetical protein
MSLQIKPITNTNKKPNQDTKISKLQCRQLDLPSCIYLINKLNKYLGEDSSISTNFKMKQIILDTINNEYLTYQKTSNKKIDLKTLLKKTIIDNPNISYSIKQKITKSNDMNSLFVKLKNQFKQDIKPKLFQKTKQKSNNNNNNINNINNININKMGGSRSRTLSKPKTVKRRKYAPRKKRTKRINVRTLKVVKHLSGNKRNKRV